MFFFFLFQFYTFIHFHGDGASWVIRERKDPSLCGIPRQPSSLAESIFFYIFYLSPPLFFFFFLLFLLGSLSFIGNFYWYSVVENGMWIGILWWWWCWHLTFSSKFCPFWRVRVWIFWCSFCVLSSAKAFIFVGYFGSGYSENFSSSI